MRFTPIRPPPCWSMVSESLRQVALGLGVPPERVRVVGNGVDLERFHPIDKAQARAALGLPPNAKVLVSVGGLCERKGFHRVIDCLPALREQGADAHLLVVGGASPEGDWGDRLRAQARDAGLEARVHFTGAVASAPLAHWQRSMQCEPHSKQPPPTRPPPFSKLPPPAITLIWLAPWRTCSRTALRTAPTPSATAPARPSPAQAQNISPRTPRGRMSAWPPVCVIGCTLMSRRGPS